jgi:hypothetical protein
MEQGDSKQTDGREVGWARYAVEHYRYTDSKSHKCSAFSGSRQKAAQSIRHQTIECLFAWHLGR